jgi:hypothetical protein
MASAFETLTVFVEALIRSYPEMQTDNSGVSVKKLRQIFVWSFAWAFGGSLELKKRMNFDTAIRESFESKSIQIGALSKITI